jgi:hypothetical protein
VQGQAELLEAFPQFAEEPLGLVTVLEPHDEVVSITHDDYVTSRGLGPPLLNPQVEDVVQKHVCQER